MADASRDTNRPVSLLTHQGRPAVSARELLARGFLRQIHNFTPDRFEVGMAEALELLADVEAHGAASVLRACADSRRRRFEDPTASDLWTESLRAHTDAVPRSHILVSEILELEDEAALLRCQTVTLEPTVEFHDEFLAAGMIPISLIRWEMTGLDDEVRHFWDDLGKER